MLALVALVLHMISINISAITTVTTSLNPTATSIHHNSMTDRLSLLALKSEISHDPNGVFDSWNDSLHFCYWQGVTCGRKHRRVTILDLSSNRLVGKFSPFIGNLSFLHQLYLSNNKLSGNIPTQLGNLLKLQILELSNNSFSGVIPTNLSRCSQLTHLVFSHNNLFGSIPIEFGSLSHLMFLQFGTNNLSGSIQVVGNMTSLRGLFLNENSFHGTIPSSFCRLKGLQVLMLLGNQLFGETPPCIFNHSSLLKISLTSNKLHGHLPTNLGLFISKLERFDISFNFFSGPIPTTLSNLSHLSYLDLSYNNFSGNVWLDGRNTPNLTILGMSFAISDGGETSDISFLDTLTNCSLLRILQLQGNRFRGVLPRSVANLSTNLEVFVLEQNQISGNLLFGLDKFVNLQAFDVSNNMFSGPVPVEIGKLENIEDIYLDRNNFLGVIPWYLGNLSKLSRLYMDRNNFQGHIPSSLGNCKSLQYLGLSVNKLTGTIPLELFHLFNLLRLGINNNNLHGVLPLEINYLQNLNMFVMSYNNFSGQIPTTISECTNLETLYMQGNSFSGPIPQSLSSLKSIQELDLSRNQLSGQIPNFLSNLSFLSYLNLSFNKLEGEVPVKGIFKNASIVSLEGNAKLCGGVPELHLPKCLYPVREKKKRFSLKVILIISFGVTIIALILALLYYFVFHKNKKNKNREVSFEAQDIRPFTKVSYQMLLEATNGFSPSNLIGQGSSGSVYKGILHQHDGDQAMVAVKVINLQHHDSIKSFMTECKTLRNIRHRNLVKIISVCSSIDFQGNDFKALVYQLMPKGSLDKWLDLNQSTNEQQGTEEKLNLLQRLNIAIDITCALDYLHNFGFAPIIHCDLKPSNILLDNDMMAHVGDFGLAKFLQGLSQDRHSSSIGVRGTIGYAPPEYGLGSEVSKEGDIYSFGIILLEMMTSKKPTDPMFSEDFNLHSYAKVGRLNNIVDIVDPSNLDDNEVREQRTGITVDKIKWIKSIIDIGIECSVEQPNERLNIKEVRTRLNAIKVGILEKRK